MLAELGSPAGYGPTGLSEAQLGEVVGALEARMGKLGADVCVLRTRKVCLGVFLKARWGRAGWGGADG